MSEMFGPVPCSIRIMTFFVDLMNQKYEKVGYEIFSSVLTAFFYIFCNNLEIATSN